jgi:hypothetical protein
MATLLLYVYRGEWWCKSDTPSLVRLGLHIAPVGGSNNRGASAVKQRVEACNPGHQVIVKGVDL